MVLMIVMSILTIRVKCWVPTFNGIALSYAKELITAMKENDLSDVRVIMGGLLNENNRAK